jgi:aminoglycoside/choline kinase family phosphotransferase
MDAFLTRAGWHGATRSMLAADASFRRYERVTHHDAIAVLMDAPPPWEDVQPFMNITRQLADFGLSVPHILAADRDAGFLLLEDLGDASFTRLLKSHPARELETYAMATQALVAMAKQSVAHATHLSATLKPYDGAIYLREAALLVEWFMPQVVGMEKAQALRAEYLDIWRGILAATPLQRNCLVHRDYHADNLFWLANRTGHAAVGMLDYQDALLGDAAYDLASLLEDARRDVGAVTVESCMAEYVRALGEDADLFATRYAVLAAQRNAKIIGIFMRLCVRDGKAHYLDYLPRVWGHFMRDVAHPALAPMRAFVETHVPSAARGRIEADVTIGGMRA